MTSSIQKFFRHNPVFHYEEFVQALEKEKKRNLNTYKVLLSRALKSQRIVRIKRGLFASIPVGANPDTYPISPFLIAGSLLKNSILAYHTALSFYNANYSIPFRFLYLTHHPSKTLYFREESYKGVRFPERLVRTHQANTFVKEVRVDNKSILVTSLERTLVDSLDRPELSGGFEEILQSFEMVSFLKIDHVVEYALLLKNATTIAKVGWFLEQHQDAFRVEQRHLQQLHTHQPKTPHYIDKHARKNGKLIKQWNLIISDVLYTKSWEEFHA